MKSTLELTRAVLESMPRRWLDLCRKLDEDLLRRPPADGEWSAIECLQHLIDTERLVFPVRVQCFLDGEDFPAFDPDSQGSAPGAAAPKALAAEFERLRIDSLKVLDKVSEEDLSRQARHGELGVVTLDEMINEWAAHDLMHTVQAEQALMQPFIAACGPWKQYFASHVVE